MRLHRIFLALLISASIQPAIAETPPTKPTELDPIIVTATRSEEKLSETLAPVIVITRADIDRLQPRDFQDLLVGLPGVSIANSGGPGKATTLFLRGANSDHVIVLIDGIKIGSVTLGTTAFEQIPVDQIDHVEIVRGPRSSLYGSEAIGGVIQIFTKRGTTGGGVVPSFAIGGGNLGSGKLETGVRGSVGTGGWYNVGLSGETTDGINAQPAANEPDNDGFHSVAGSLSGGWNFANGAEISANWLRARSRNEFDGAFQNTADSTQQVFGINTHFTPLSPWRVTLSAGESQDLSDNFHDPAPPATHSSFKTFRDNYSWQNDLSIAAGQLLSLGVDYQHDSVNSSTNYTENSRDDTGVFTQYQGEFGGHAVAASFRHDNNEQFGGHDTGGAAYAYHFSNGIRLGASYGTAFKAPTFNQLYFPFGFGVPTFQPEKSSSIELNAGGSHRAFNGTWNWALNGYETKIDNLIVLTPSFTQQQIGKALIRGLELQLGGQWQAWRVQNYLTWMEPRNQSGDANNGNVLTRRARRTARVDLDYDFGIATLGASLNGIGRSYNDLANAQPVAGYGTLDLRAGWQMLPRWQLQLKAANVFDRRYETVKGFAQLGSTYFVTVRYTPTKP